MGAVAMMNLPDYRLAQRTVINIATPVRFELMFERVTRAGFPTKCCIRCLHRITAQHGTHWHLIRDRFHQACQQFAPLFIHDTDDRFAPFEHLQPLVNHAPERLIQTSGLGHRILGDTGVIKDITARLTT